MREMVKLPISTIMTRKVITVAIDDDLTNACSMFREKKIRHLPVLKGERLVGILSYNAVIRLSFCEVYDDSSVIDRTVYKLLGIKQVMVENPIKVTPDDSIRKVANILIKNRFHALPVVEHRKLVGIISTTDLLRYLIAN
jgi:predicted transcriptional regulator